MNVYYVYLYLDPRKPGEFKYGKYSFEYEPFYVGKGTKSRLNRHLKKGGGTNPIKSNKISKIIKDGYNPIILKLKDNLSNDEAIKLEIELIKIIGRITRKNGPLTNFTKGGETFLGYKHKQDYIEKLNKPVVKYDIDGNFIEEYKSVDDAGKRNNMYPQTVSQICRGDIKIYNNKYIFKYKSDRFEKRVRNKKQYPVIRIDYNFNEKEYKSLTIASSDNNTTPSRVNSVCMGDRFQTGGFLYRYKSHPKLKEFNKKIKENFGKYLDILDREIEVDNIIYKNILHVISIGKNVKVNNLYNLLLNNKVYRFNEFKSYKISKI